MMYSIKQVNSRTINIRSLEGIQVQDASYSSVAEISGNPEHLLNIEGDALIRGIITFMNEYKSLSGFVKEIQKLDIKMTPISVKNYRISGKIALNDDKWPLNELLKFLIRSNLF